MNVKGLLKNRRFGSLLPLIVGAIIWAAVPLFYLQGTSAQNSNEDEIRINASLSGAPINGVTPFGVAEYKVIPSRNRRTLEVYANSVNRPAGTVLTVIVDNATAGTMTLDSLQNGVLNLETQNGQTVPVISNGSTVDVREGSTTILSGIFGVVNPTPTPTGSPSPSPTGSPTPSPTGSPTPTPTGTPTPSPTGTPGVFEIRAGLVGAPINGVAPFGRAKYEVYPSGNREFEVEIFSVNLPANTILSVFVDNSAVGNLFLRPSGSGELKLETEHGQQVPVVSNGSTVQVKNGSTVIAEGIFSGGTPSPTPTPTGSPTPTPPPGQAARFFESKLTGNQNVPQTSTDAKGFSNIFLNDAGNQIQVFVGYFNLTSSQIAASINGPALPGSNGPVLFNLGVVGGTSGFIPVRTFAVTPEQVAQLRSGQLYVSISTTNNANGEIRGQIKAESHHGDFGGDGLAEVSVFRESTGAWYFLNSSDNTFNFTVLGGIGDKNVPGDYDGDGVNDVAVFHQSGVWEISLSASVQRRTAQWGIGTDRPVVGDYDGDGKADLTVYRGGIWYTLLSSTGSYRIEQWGIAEDKPVAGDYDGDGRDDLAVFRPSTGVWYIRRSSDSTLFAASFGIAEDVPLVGDFDGDVRDDITVWRPSTGVFYHLRSIDNDFRAYQFGSTGDIPVIGDFDDDWLADIAVFRPSTGTWHILKSADSSYRAIQFGTNGDKPAVASYIP
jgi:hypothetical protein